MTWGGAVRACLERDLLEGRQRWHFQHGPIDLIIGLEGAVTVLDLCIELAWQRFREVLEELVSELVLLKTSVSISPDDCSSGSHTSLNGRVAQRMFQSCAPYGRVDGVFVTPMAAVAGCVAQEILSYLQASGIQKAWVNNGGDIAWYAPAQVQVAFSVGVPALPQVGTILLLPEDKCWGVATSGWRGRSQSLGIADSVTVIAQEAGQADVAATLIANEVSLKELATEHCQVIQKPARQVKDQSDLGDRLVTVSVGPLSLAEIKVALDSGERYAQTLLSRDWIRGAVLCLKGQFRVCGMQAGKRTMAVDAEHWMIKSGL
jgi:uncharacterized protein